MGVILLALFDHFTLCPGRSSHCPRTPRTSSGQRRRSRGRHNSLSARRAAAAARSVGPNKQESVVDDALPLWLGQLDCDGPRRAARILWQRVASVVGEGTLMTEERDRETERERESSFRRSSAVFVLSSLPRSLPSDCCATADCGGGWGKMDERARGKYPLLYDSPPSVRTQSYANG